MFSIFAFFSLLVFTQGVPLPPNTQLEVNSKKAEQRSVQSFCGVVEDNETSPNIISFNRNNLTYRILNFTPDLSSVLVRHDINKALSIWEGATKLKFREIFYGKADITFRFVKKNHRDAYRFDGRGGVLAHAFFPGMKKYGGDVHFDEDETWTHGPSTGSDLFYVSTHEIGHAIGLLHSKEVNSVMYPTYPGYTPNLTLHKDDILAIQKLYSSTSGCVRCSAPANWTVRETNLTTNSVSARLNLNLVLCLITLFLVCGTIALVCLRSKLIKRRVHRTNSTKTFEKVQQSEL